MGMKYKIKRVHRKSKNNNNVQTLEMSRSLSLPDSCAYMCLLSSWNGAGIYVLRFTVSINHTLDLEDLA